jgi:hypothetical protein
MSDDAKELIETATRKVRARELVENAIREIKREHPKAKRSRDLLKKLLADRARDDEELMRAIAGFIVADLMREQMH